MAQVGAPAAAPRNGSQLLSREEAKALADRVLALSSADQARVNITTQWSGNTRFADGSITTSGSVTNTAVTVTAGKRQASASTNVLDEASFKRTVDLAARRGEFTAWRRCQEGVRCRPCAATPLPISRGSLA